MPTSLSEVPKFGHLTGEAGRMVMKARTSSHHKVRLTLVSSLGMDCFHSLNAFQILNCKDWCSQNSQNSQNNLWCLMGSRNCKGLCMAGCIEALQASCYCMGTLSW
jgi:hypothetical protein